MHGCGVLAPADPVIGGRPWSGTLSQGYAPDQGPMTRWTTALALAAAAALGGAAPAAADSLLFRCGDNICRAAPDGSVRGQLTTDGRAGGPAYQWLSASRDG